jgi:hypothetical protein
MQSLRHLSAVLFLCSIMSFPRSFLIAKLLCLGFFVLVHLIDHQRNQYFRVHTRVLVFYCCVAIGGLTWSLLGLADAGEPQGVYDSLRLYVGWSAAYLLIVTLLRNGNGLRDLHSAIVLSGLLIAVINLFGLFDQYLELGLLSEGVRDELRLAIGFHEGYIQITSHNIGSLLFITPYLIAVQFCRNTAGTNGWLTKFSLVACIVLSALSGRRALWLCIALTPLIIGLIAVLSSGLSGVKPAARKLISAMACGFVAALVVIGANNAQLGESGVVVLDRLSEAFSAEDERTIQSRYLVSAFADQPMFGSGFGAYAGYLRNDEAPWLYELTYFQLLFNCGLVGLLFWSALAGTYFFLAARVIRGSMDRSGQPLCLIVGVCGILLGAYSNPYLASFDYLIFVAMLPFVASLNPAARDSSAKLAPVLGRNGELPVGT